MTTGIDWYDIPRVPDPMVRRTFETLAEKLQAGDEIIAGLLELLRIDFAAIYNAGTDLGQSLSASSPEKFVQFESDFEVSRGIVPLASENRMTLTRTGVYVVLGSFSVTSDTNATVVELTGHWNGSDVPMLHSKAEIVNLGDYEHMAVSGLVYADAAFQDLEMYVESDQNATVTSDECSLVVLRLPWEA